MKKHFAATAYIVSRLDGEFKVLLHKHKKYNIWLGIGGHVEDDENPIETVIREVKEEANLDINFKNSKKIQNSKLAPKILELPFNIQEEKIPAYGDKEEHYHIDFNYLAYVTNPQRTKMQEEFNWFSKNDLKKLGLDKDVKFLAENALKTFGSVKKSSKKKII